MKIIIRGLLILVFLGLLLAGGGYVYLTSLLQAVDPNDSTNQIFVVDKGMSLQQVGLKLANSGIIKHALGFRIAAYLDKNASIQSGSFRLQKSMTPAEILKTLKTGRLDVWITLIEGWRREEFAAALEKSLGSFGNFSSKEFLKQTEGKEGLLSPNTYLVPVNSSTSDLVNLLTRSRIKELESFNLQPEQYNHILTVASLVEREAKTQASRKMVAGIIKNRLDQKWPLQIDATLQFAKVKSVTNNDWWPDPLAADKDIQSPYNTYKNPGLPPGPICAPSLDSIRAAVEPTTTEYMYYLTGNDGKMYYANTLAEHNQNIKSYLQ